MIVAALLVFYVYSSVPKDPSLTSASRQDTLSFDNRSRTFVRYSPKSIKPKPALLIVFHGTGIDGAKVRQWTGYEFDQMADKYGFLGAYPDGYDKDWNDCRKGQFLKTKKENIDDVGFINALISHTKRNLVLTQPKFTYLVIPVVVIWHLE